MQLKGEFYEHEGKPYCKDHLPRNLPNKGICVRCKQLIETSGQGCSDGLGGVYHLGKKKKKKIYSKIARNLMKLTYCARF